MGILLTGATGFLGGELLARYAERPEQPVYALVRAGSDEEASARIRRTLGWLCGWGAGANVIAVRGDLTQPGLGLDPHRRDALAERTTSVVHCAATVSFDAPLEEARAINVEGTRRLLELAHLAARRGGLDCFSHVSTAYVAGTRRGPFGEDELDVGQRFRNTYERSKFETEQVVRAAAPELPVQILRPSIVVGDSRTGWTSAFNVLYWPLRTFVRGGYPAIPARRSAPVDVVPVDYVADAILALAGRPGTTYHLTAGERTSSVGELIDLAAAYFGRPAPRVVPPGLYRRVAHPLLLRRADERRRRALAQSGVFFPYFGMRVRYDDAEVRAVLGPEGIKPPSLRDYFARLMDFAVATRWGKEPVARWQAGRSTLPAAA
jgi:long-chain acyl-CoA synthetase